MIRNTKLLSMALVCGLAGVNQQASARPKEVEPSYFFRAPYDVVHETWQAAYSSMNPHMAARPDPGTGLNHWRVVGIQTPRQVIFYNGRFANQAVKWEQLEYNYKTKSYDRWEPREMGPFSISMIPECPTNYRLVQRDQKVTPAVREDTYVCVDEKPQPEPECDPCNRPGQPVPIPEKTGNPIYHSTGLKEQVEIDYQSSGPGGLKFIRTYRSDRNGWEHNYQITGMDLNKIQDVAHSNPLSERPRSAQCYWAPATWTGKMRCFRPMFSALANDFSLQRGNGSVVKFGNATDQNPAANVNDRLTPVYDLDGRKIANDVYNAANDSTERYGLDGYIQTITSRGGLVQTFTYAAPPAGSGVNSPSRLLESVEDPYGRALTFTHDSAGRIETMTTPEGGIYKYAYNAFGSVSSVTYPDEKVRTYLYNEPAYTKGANLPFALTGILDENGVRYATYNYDFTGKALSTEHAGGVEKYQFNYNSDETYVTGPLGANVVFRYTSLFGIRRTRSQDQPAGAGSKSASKSMTFDANANVSTFTDVNGTVTAYTYDARNLELTRTQKSGTPLTVITTTTTEWHPSYRLPLRI
ncbi:RHS repeat protein, partial [Massilia atriviolacea]